MIPARSFLLSFSLHALAAVMLSSFSTAIPSNVPEIAVTGTSAIEIEASQYQNLTPISVTMTTIEKVSEPQLEIEDRQAPESVSVSSFEIPSPQVELEFEVPTPTTPTRDVVSMVAAPNSSGEIEQRAELAENDPPRYPTEAIRRRLEGVVILRITISEKGSIDEVIVETSSGHPVLDSAAVEAVSQWKAKPSLRSGRPIVSVERLPIRFRL